MTGPGPSDPSGQAPPPPEPVAPPPAPDAGAAAAPGADQWGQPGKTPDWAAQAQGWRPAEVASGPAAGIAYADLTTRIIAYIVDVVILFIVAIVVNLVLLLGGAAANYFGLRGAGARAERQAPSTDAAREPAAPAA